MGYVDFQAVDDKEAKTKILEVLRRKLSRVKWTRDRTLSVMAMPPMKAEDPRKGLDGNRMIRNRYSYSGKRILRIKNPELALVQGYGPEALEKLRD